MSQTIHRRMFLKLSGMTLAVTAANPLLAHVRARGGRPSPRQSLLNGKTLVLVFQRGGCDGLNVCVPIESSEHAIYQGYRPGLALQMSELDPYRLDSEFAFHPELSELYALYQQGKVAVLPNVHYDEGSRSHFDSQAFYESGTPWNKLTTQGWLSRHMELNPGGDVFRALSFASSVPAAFQGQPTSLVFSTLASLSVSGSPTRDAQYFDFQEQVYALPEGTRPYDPEVQRTGADLVAAIRALRATTLPPAGATYPTGATGTRFRELASLIKSGAFQIELAEIDQNGYDTHTGQGRLTAAEGLHPYYLDELSRCLDAFYTDLGPAASADVLTLVITEFGRTARENGSGGTDHGSATTTIVVGGSIVPGVHFGPLGWIGLSNLRDNRDLQHSLDFRDVYSEVLKIHLGNNDPGAVFPGWNYTPVGFLS